MGWKESNAVHWSDSLAYVSYTSSPMHTLPGLTLCSTCTYRDYGVLVFVDFSVPGKRRD
jgi:hypothetical protein